MYDVFLSHHTEDKPEVEGLARRLASEAGLRPFLDKWHLVPGAPFQDELEVALQDSATTAVFFGRGGLGPWHHEEVRAALARAVQLKDDYRIIPVLLPGARREDVKGFLAQRLWVDFTNGLDDAEAFRRLVAGIKGQAPESDTYRLDDEPAPYRGLLAFDEGHARFFFGRQSEADAVVARLKQSPCVTVVGASGVGKSSLVLAGVVPRWKKTAGSSDGVWRMRPGSRPLRALADQVATLVPPGERLALADSLTARFAAQSDGLRTALATLTAQTRASFLLVVDQLEELFTLAPEEGGAAEVDAFLRNLQDAVERGHGALRVVATLRADFFERSLRHPTLRALLQDRQVLLGPMGEESLRDIIVQPAQEKGAFLEKGVVSAVLRDVARQPGALPLLEYALDALWRARSGAWLKLSTYEASGGVARVLAEQAEATLQALSPQAREVARRIFLRLTALGEGTEDTRRRVARSELRFQDTSDEEVEDVLQHLSSASARLLVLEEGTVEVAHEVLIREWPTLRGWLDADRRLLRLHRRLTEAANDWSANAEEPSFLYSGARLLDAAEAFPVGAPQLNVSERRFLDASLQARDARRQEEKAQAERLLGEATARAEAERKRAEAEGQRAEALKRSTQRLLALVVGAIVAVIALSVSAWALGKARSQAQGERNIAERERNLARSRELTAYAVRSQDDDSELSLLLLKEAARSASTEQLHDATSSWLGQVRRITLRGHTDMVWSARFSADGSRIVTASDDKTARVWNARTGVLEQTFSGHTDSVRDANFNPAGTFVVTASMDKTVRIWNVATGKLHASLGEQLAGVSQARFNRDGSRIVAASLDGFIRVWDFPSGKPHTLASPGGPAITHISRDGSFVVSTQNGVLQVWELSSGARQAHYTCGSDCAFGAQFSPDGTKVVTFGEERLTFWDARKGLRQSVLGGQFKNAFSVGSNPDGARIVTRGTDKTALLWPAVADSPPITLTGHADTVRDAWFSPDGMLIVTASDDKTARVWSARDGRALAVLSAHTAGVVDVSFNSDGSRVVTTSEDNTARIWDLSSGPLRTELSSNIGGVATLKFSTDGALLLAPNEDGAVRIWNLRTGKLSRTTSNIGNVWSSVPASPDASRIVALEGKTARVLDIANDAHSVPLIGHSDDVLSASFSPDASLIVTGSKDWSARVWDAVSGTSRFVLSGHAGPVNDAVFSPDGALIATIGQDKTVRIWNVATGTLQVRLEGHQAEITTVSFSNDGTRIVTASDDSTARIWSTSKTAPPLVLRHGGFVRTAHFNRTGTLVVTTSNEKTARLWDAKTGALQGAPFDQSNFVWDAGFSPDGTRLLTASMDKTVRVYDVESHGLQAVLRGHTDGVNWASFCPDGECIVSLDNDSSIRLWGREYWDAEKALATQAKREFTCEERQRYLHDTRTCPPPDAKPQEALAGSPTPQ